MRISILLLGEYMCVKHKSTRQFLYTFQKGHFTGSIRPSMNENIRNFFQRNTVIHKSKVDNMKENAYWRFTNYKSYAISSASSSFSCTMCIL